jgi:hypothetical protein
MGNNKGRIEEPGFVTYFLEFSGQTITNRPTFASIDLMKKPMFSLFLQNLLKVYGDKLVSAAGLTIPQSSIATSQTNTAPTTAKPATTVPVAAQHLISGSGQNIFKSAKFSLFESMDKNFKDKNNPIYQLGKAIHEKDTGKIYQLLKKSASTFQLKEYPENLHSPLHIAAEEGNKEVLGIMLEHGFEIDHSYSAVSSRTALSFSKNDEVKNYLIGLGADPGKSGPPA